MLKQIRELVDDAVNSPITFPEFFAEYVMRVQDSNIENEAISRFRNLDINVKTLNSIDKSIEREQRELVNK